MFRTRALLIKEQRAELVKHHLWVLWTDYFKPPHFEKYPQLHDLFNEATKPPAPPAARARSTRPKARNCSTRSPRSTRSSGRPRRPDASARAPTGDADRWGGASGGHMMTAVAIRPARDEDVPRRRDGARTRRVRASAATSATSPRSTARGPVRPGRRRCSATSPRTGGRAGRASPSGSSTSPPGRACTASTWRTSTCARRPRHRGRAALLATLAADLRASAATRRLEWWVLDWNPAARFYAALGAADGRVDWCRTGWRARAAPLASTA